MSLLIRMRMRMLMCLLFYVGRIEYITGGVRLVCHMILTTNWCQLFFEHHQIMEDPNPGPLTENTKGHRMNQARMVIIFG
mmetsp:Transcript_45592/g.46171  ORF Transcript_45592/g.46171 Transcript_45592/m.46171 type:complete len:80 (-) Transcript_45592:77-316(-)